MNRLATGSLLPARIGAARFLGNAILALVSVTASVVVSVSIVLLILYGLGAI